MNALRSNMNDYGSLSEIPRYTTPVSVFNRSVEEMQSVSVVPNRYLWQDSLWQMLCEETSITQSSAALAKEKVERFNIMRKAEGLCRLLDKWREEDDEEQQEVSEYSRINLGEGEFC